MVPFQLLPPPTHTLCPLGPIPASLLSATHLCLIPVHFLVEVAIAAAIVGKPGGGAASSLGTCLEKR